MHSFVDAFGGRGFGVFVVFPDDPRETLQADSVKTVAGTRALEQTTGVVCGSSSECHLVFLTHALSVLLAPQ